MRRIKKSRKSFKKANRIKNAKSNRAKGLDVGTSFIHCAENRRGGVGFRSVRNVFFDMEYTNFTRSFSQKKTL